MRGLPATAASLMPLGWAEDTGMLICAAAHAGPGLDVEFYGVAPESPHAVLLLARKPSWVHTDRRGLLLVDSATLVANPSVSAPSWVGPVMMERAGGRWRAQFIGRQPDRWHRRVLWAGREGDSVRLVVQDCRSEGEAGENMVSWRTAQRGARTFHEFHWRDGQIARAGHSIQAPSQCCGDGVASGDGSRVFVPVLDPDLRRCWTVFDLSAPSVGWARLDAPDDAREAYPSPGGSALLLVEGTGSRVALGEPVRVWAAGVDGSEARQLELPASFVAISGVAWLDGERVLLSVPLAGLVQLSVVTGKWQVLLDVERYLAALSDARSPDVESAREPAADAPVRGASDG